MSTHEPLRAHCERLHRLAWRLLGGDDQGALDVVQRALAKASRGLDGSRDEASLATFLTRIVVRETTQYRQRVVKTAAADESRSRIRAAVAGLSEGERMAFVLVHLEGHTLAQTSEIVARSGTVQHELHQAFERLRIELADLEMNDRELLETIRTRFRPEAIASWESIAEGVQSRLRSKRRAQALVLAVLVVGALFAWPRSTEHEAHGVVAPAPGDEVVLRATLQGWVATVSGATVANALVTAGDSSGVTDPDGAFAIPNLPAHDIQVSVRAAGLSTAEARVDPRRPVTLQLLPVTGRGSIDAMDGGTVTDKKGFSLVVPPDSFPGVVGTVDVEWTVLRDAGSLGAAPAPLATEHDLLESLGMVEVRFAQNSVPIEFRGTADLTWPLAAHALFREGDLAGLYSYDRNAGVWREDGEGTVKKGRIHAQVTHFSWWSCDRPIAERGCVAGRLDGPLSSTIYLEGDDYLARVATAPGQDGAFCLDAMPARSARLFSRSRVGDRCYVSSERVIASGAGTSCAMDRSECATVRLWSTEVACPQPTPWRGDRRERIPSEEDAGARRSR